VEGASFDDEDMVYDAHTHAGSHVKIAPVLGHVVSIFCVTTLCPRVIYLKITNRFFQGHGVRWSVNEIGNALSTLGGAPESEGVLRSALEVRNH
jgi:hypothetical protein